MFDAGLLLDNLTNPPILFFFLGMAATLVRSDLEIPQPLPKLFSLYLLFAIGFKGGHELAVSPLNAGVFKGLGAGVLMSFLVPVYAYWILRKKLNTYNSVAIAAAFGSISAVTFITATVFLQRLGVTYGGHMVAAMALMESPAVIVAVLILRRQIKSSDDRSSIGHLLREAFTNGAVFLLLGSLIIGMLVSGESYTAMKPFTQDIFKGMLSFFLLDMGLVAARRMNIVFRSSRFLIVFSLVMPLVNATIAIGLSWMLGLSPGDALLLTVLCASASYIAVPAVMRSVVPEANPSLYVTMALAITFPFNVFVGIPLYYSIIQLLHLQP